MLDNLTVALEFLVNTERASSKLTFRVKPITDTLDSSHRLHLFVDPLSAIFPCAILIIAALSVKFGYLSQTNYSTCRPRLSLLKPEDELVEL